MGALLNKFRHSSQPKSRVTDADKAVLELKKARDTLTRYRRKCQENIKHHKATAVQLARSDHKDKALLVLKKVRTQEALITSTQGKLDNLQKMVDDIEQAQLDATVIEALKDGNDALKEIQRFFDLDQIEQLMEDSAASIAYQQEVSELLGTSIMDRGIEEEAEKELEEMLSGMDEEEPSIKLPDVPQEPLPVKLPSVPQHELENDSQPQLIAA